MANNRTLRVVVSADPKPSLTQLEKDIQTLSDQLISNGTKITIPVEIGEFKADKAIDKLKSDIESAIKGMSVTIGNIKVTGNGIGSTGKSKSGSSNAIINESDLNTKAYFTDSSSADSAIKEITNDLVAAGNSIKNIKTSVRDTNGEINSFSVEMKNVLGNTEKLEYALRQVETSSGTVKDAYVQINRQLGNTSGGKTGLTEIQNAIKDIEGSLDFDSLTVGLNPTQINAVNKSFNDLKATIDGTKVSTDNLNDKTLEYIQSLRDAMNEQVIAFRDENYRNSPVDNSWDDSSRLKQTADSVSLLMGKYESLNEKYKMSGDILDVVREKMAAIMNAQTNGVRDDNLFGFDEYIDSADDVLSDIAKIDNQYEILISKAKNMNLNKDALNELSSLEVSMNRLRSIDMSDGASEWNKALSETQYHMENLSKAVKQIKVDESAKKSFDRQKASVISLQAAIDKAKKSLEDYYTKNTKLSQSPEFVNNYNAIMNKDYGNSSEGYAQLAKDVNAYKLAAKDAGLETKTLGDKIYAAYQKFGGWAIITQTMSRAISLFKDMISNVVDLDTAMTELYKVTNETSETYTRFLNDSAESAREVGATMTDVINSTADFARLGYSLDDSEELAKAALIYKSVGDGIADVDEASQSIISTMKAFDIEAENAMTIVDEMNYTGNNFAISSAGIGEALIRSASSLSAAGNTMEQSIALITAMNSTVQDADKVGTTLKTLTMYLRAAKTEAESAGESTDGMASSISELRDEILTLTNNEVDIMLDSENFKSTYQIMQEISDVWNDISDVDQANLLEIIGGKRNSDAVVSLIKNFQTAKDVMDGLGESAGSADQELATFKESIEGRMNSLRATFQELSSTVINSNLIKNIVSGGDSILQVINNITEKIGTLPGIITGIGAILSKNDLGIVSTSGKGFAERLSNQIYKIDYKSAASGIQKYNDALKNSSVNIQGTIDEIKNANNSLGNFIQSIYKSTNSIEANTVTLDMYKKSMSSLGAVAKGVGVTLKNLAVSFGIGLAIELVSFGISKLVEWIQNLSYTAEEAKEVLEDFNTTQNDITNNINKIESLKDRYEELAEGVDANGKNVSLTTDEYDEFKSIIDTLIEISPSIVKAYNAQGEALLNYKDIINEATEAQRELAEQETASLIAEYPKLFKGQKSDYKDTYSSASDAVASAIYEIEDNFISDFESLLGLYGEESTSKIVDILEKAGVSLSDSFSIGGVIAPNVSDISEIALKYKDILTVIRGLKDENGDPVFNSDQIHKYESSLNAVRVKYDELTSSVSDIVEGMKPWIEDQDWFSDIPDDSLSDYYESIANKILYLGDSINKMSSSDIQDLAVDIKDLFDVDVSPQEQNAINEMLESVKDLSTTDIPTNSSIEETINAYKDAADVASRLRKEYRETGKISIDTYLEMIKSSKDFSDILEVEGDAYTINDNKLQEYVDTKRDAAVKAEIERNATAEEVASLLKYGVTTSAIVSKIDEYSDKLSDLATLQKDHADGTEYAKDEVNELLESYPELTFEVDATTGKFKLQEKSLSTLNDMLKSVIESIITLNQEMMKLQGIEILTDVYGRSETTANSQYSKYYENVEENDIDTFDKWIEQYGEPEINEEAIRKAISSYAQKKALNEAFENQDYSNIVSEKSSSSSSKTDSYKEKFEEWYDTQKHYLNMGQITEEEYYDALEAMNISYFAGMKKYLDEYRKYEEEVYKGRQGLVSDALEEIDNEYAKHGNNSEAIKQIEALTEKYKSVLSPDLQKTIDSKKLSYTVSLYNEQSDELEKQLDLLEDQEGSEEEQIEIYRKLQDEVIKLSNYYKSIGYSDDSETLQELEEKWQSYAKSIRKIAKEMYDDIKDAQVKALEEVNDTIDDASDAIDTVLDEVVNYIKRKTQNEIDALEDERDAISDHYDELSDREEEYWDNLKEEENDSYDYRKEQSEKYYEELIDNIEDAADAQKKALDDELDKYKKLIDAKKESLQDAKDEEDYNKKVAEMNKNISSIQGQIDLLALDNSQEARAKRLDLEEQLAEALNELAEYQAEYSLDKQLDALDKEYDAFEESIKNQQDLIEESTDNEVEMYEKERDEKLDAIERVHEAELESIEERKERALQRIEDEKNAELAAYDDKISALEDYLDQEGTLYNDANELIRSGGESLWNELMEYCRTYYKEVESLEDAWNKVLSAVDEYNGGDLDLSETKKKLNEAKSDNESKIDELDEETYQELVDKTRKEMRRNGEDWWMTEDAELRKQLSDANKKLAKAFNESVGYEALTYDAKKGIWYLDGVKFYHEGGIVGSKNKKLKNDETFAVLQDGEAVYTSKMQDTIGKFIDFAKNITSGIESVISVKDPAKYISRSFERDVMPRYSSDVVIDHLFEFKADNVTSESLPETEKMMKRVSEYTIGLLEDRLTRRGLKAKVKGSAI